MAQRAPVPLTGAVLRLQTGSPADLSAALSGLPGIITCVERRPAFDAASAFSSSSHGNSEIWVLCDSEETAAQLPAHLGAPCMSKAATLALPIAEGTVDHLALETLSQLPIHGELEWVPLQTKALGPLNALLIRLTASASAGSVEDATTSATGAYSTSDQSTERRGGGSSSDDSKALRSSGANNGVGVAGSDSEKRGSSDASDAGKEASLDTNDKTSRTEEASSSDGDRRGHKVTSGSDGVKDSDDEGSKGNGGSQGSQATPGSDGGFASSKQSKTDGADTSEKDVSANGESPDERNVFMRSSEEEDSHSTNSREHSEAAENADKAAWEQNALAPGDPSVLEVLSSDEGDIWATEQSDDARRGPVGLFIRNLPTETTPGSIYALVQRYGYSLASTEIREIHVPYRSGTHGSRGFAFVLCGNRTVAERLCQELHRKVRMGRRALQAVVQRDSWHLPNAARSTTEVPPEYVALRAPVPA